MRVSPQEPSYIAQTYLCDCFGSSQPINGLFGDVSKVTVVLHCALESGKMVPFIGTNVRICRNAVFNNHVRDMKEPQMRLDAGWVTAKGRAPSRSNRVVSDIAKIGTPQYR